MTAPPKTPRAPRPRLAFYALASLLVAIPSAAFAHAPAAPAPAPAPAPQATPPSAPTPPAPPTHRTSPPTPPEPPEPPCPTVKINGVEVSGEARGFLGVEPTRLSPALRDHFGLPTDTGVLIGEVIGNSAAEAAGLQVGDLVTRIGGQEITNPWDLTSAIASRKGGEAVEVELWRDGTTRTVTAVLDSRERCAFDLSHALPLEALRGLEALEDLDLDFDFDFDEVEIERITEESLAAAQIAIREALGTLDEVDWETQLQGLEKLEEMELERVEEKMREIERRMQELERELEEEAEREVEKTRREVERQRHEIERQRSDQEARTHVREALEHELAAAHAELEAELAAHAAER